MKKIFNGAFFVLFLITLLMSSWQTTFASSTILGTTGSGPRGITIDSAGNIYTANVISNNVSKITPEGVSTILGTTGVSPYDITIDAAGNIYTTNSGSSNVSKITPEGVSSILGSTGSGPFSITIDAAGNIYTANQGSGNVSKITPEGVSTVFGFYPDTYSYALTIDAAGNIYTANYNDNTVSKITPAGGAGTLFGSTGSNPTSIAIDTAGNIYTGANYVSKITPEGVSTFFTDIIFPNAVATDTTGYMYAVNAYNDVFMTTPSGVSTTVGTTGANPSDMIVIKEEDYVYIYITNADDDTVSKITIINPIHDVTITSGSYTVSTVGGGSETITNVPFGTTKADFLLNLTKANEAQTWNDTNISDPVATGDTLIVTAEDGETTATYTITVDAEMSHDVTISSLVYNITIDGDEGYITNVPNETSQEDFLANLTMGNENQYWDYGDDEGNVSDPVQTGDTLIVWAEDEETSVTYTITVNTPEPNIFWYKTGINDNWNTLLGNWWTNEAHTEQAEELPTSGAVVKTLGTVGPSANTDTWTEPYSIDATATGIYLSGTSSISAEMFGNVTFNDEVSNSSNITGNAIFYNSTQNDGIITGNAIFNNSSIFLSGSVSGNVTFNDFSALNNNGEVDGLATFNDNSTNGSFSTVNGDAIFNDESINMGPVLGNATFNDESYNINTVSGNAIFNDITYNQGAIEGYACFRDESYNNGDVGGLLCPPIVITSTATDIAQTSVTLNGEITEAIESVDVLGFEYGLTTNYGESVIDEEYLAEETFSVFVTGLNCGTTYHFRAYGTNDFDTNYGDDVTFTTASCSSSSSGGSKPSRPKIISTTLVTCPPGHKYNTQSGQLCTVFTPTPGEGEGNSTTCLITLTLRQGNRGEQVKCLQTKLNITSDGMFGPMTKSAVMLFQKNHNLVQDGIVGPKTRAEL